ncbi:hypothetical protein HY450_02585 [Candidatus Pacearchaeota archaeon]|nr:hypothetical protein [Candidatus Pacearchaeota archaeon]
MKREEISQKLAGIRENILKKKSSRQKKSQRTFSKIKKGVLAVAVAGAVITGIGARDYLMKRQDYPERNVLFRSSNITNIAGNVGEGTDARADRESTTKFYEGGGGESKVGTYLCETIREIRGDAETFNMDNSQKIRIASAIQKPEIFQAGLSIGGSLNYREQFAEIVVGTGEKSKAPQKYMVYKISPERGSKDKDIDVRENVDGTKEIINRLIELRGFPLGFLFGKHYRTGTVLEDYGKDPKNKKLEKEVLEKIKVLDSQAARDASTRERILEELTVLEEQMENITTYSTFEDGFLKVLPQDSVSYLGSYPSITERIKHWAGFGRKERHRLAIENNLDLWPGYFPLLSELSIGSGKDRVYPFDKYNNGGYTIKDKYGKIGSIEIEDFMLRYGQDVLYSYFLDLNGDGELDKEKELIGQVLCRMTHDERRTLEESISGKKQDRNFTYTINFSFMAPDNDLKKGMEYFRHCAQMETMMPDQIHRGNGQHSLLLLINDQRSDLILYDDLSIQNMSRALTQESTLAAKYDIIKILNATQRPYAHELAQLYGVEKEFEGQYASSPLLHKRIELGPLPGIALTLCSIAGGLYYLRKRCSAPKKSASERLDKLQKSVVTNP